MLQSQSSLQSSVNIVHLFSMHSQEEPVVWVHWHHLVYFLDAQFNIWHLQVLVHHLELLICGGDILGSGAQKGLPLLETNLKPAACLA